MSTGLTSVTTVICWELSLCMVFRQLLNSHQCLIQVPFPSCPLWAFTWVQCHQPAPRGVGKTHCRFICLSFAPEYPSVIGHYPTDFQLLTPDSVSQCHLKSLLGQGDTSLRPLIATCSSLSSKLSPEIHVSKARSLTFPVTLLFPVLGSKQALDTSKY